MIWHKLLLLLPSLFLAAPAQARFHVSSEKTIEVSATEKIEVIAETATLRIGCQTQAQQRTLPMPRILA
jgi:uncharacterized protein YggE